VLAAINPIEQIRKSNDVAKKADAATLAAANDRFLATFSCYPWYFDGTECLAASQVTGLAVGMATPYDVDDTTFETAAGANYWIEVNDEIKEQFKTRSSITGAMLTMFEDADGQLSVCFTPESNSSRTGGLGPIVSWQNVLAPDAAVACAADYDKDDDACKVCVPK